MAIQSETLLGGRYKIANKLGENAIGETFIATDTQTNAKVVVKELGSEHIVRTYEAIKACGNLEGIVNILDISSDNIDGNPVTYAVMEYVAGVTLEDYLAKSNAKFPLARIKDLLNPVVNSMIKLGESGISHGNISADNFIFTNQGKLKLIGFGHIGGKISPKSAPYAPLELYAENALASEVSDIYSISTFIYRCVTGIVPQDALQRKENDQCIKPTAAGVEMDKNEESALLMGMSVDSAKRFMKLTAFHKALFGTSSQQPQPSTQAPVQVQPPQPQTPPQTVAEPPKQAKQAKNTKPEKQPKQAKQAKQAKNTKPEKSSSPVLVILIVVGIIIAVILGFVVYKLANNYYGDGDSSTSFTMSNPASKTSENETQSVSSEDILANIDELMQEGQYEQAISALIDNGVGKDDGASVLQESIDNLYSQCVNEVNALANSGRFDDAYTVIDEKIQYFADLKGKLDYVDNTYDQEISQLRDTIEPKLVEYYSNEATNAANADDEAKMTDAFSQLEGKMDDTELSNKKEADYTKLVLAHMVNMSSSGSEAKEIRDYLDSMLTVTGNNCRVMEFWDYYDNLYYVSLKRSRMTASSVRSYNGYVIQNSSVQELNYSDINNLSEYELYFALYEIYARHGRIFTDSAVSEHFNNTNWYNPVTSPETFDETTLNDIEKKNVATILQYCRDMGYRS